MKKFIIGTLAVVFSATALYAGAGTVSAQFLKLSSGGRASALGNAFMGVTGDAMSVFYNPAGIVFSDKKQVSLMYSTYLEEISYQNAVFSMPVGEKLGIGVGVTMLSYGTMKRYDSNMNLMPADLTASDMAVNIAAAYRMSASISGGLTLKYVSETLDDKVATTPTADIGLAFRKDKLTAGLSAQNLFGSMKFITQEEKIPMIIRAGAGYRAMDKLMLLVDLNMLDSGVAAGLGVEITPVDLLAVRVGYAYNGAVKGFEGLTGITAGIGINLKQFSLDVAYVPYGDLGSSIKAGLSAKF